MKLIDLSRPIIRDMPVYPGDDKVVLYHTHKFETDRHNNHRLEAGMHVGSHIDGPMHMTDSDIYICDLPLDRFSGSACIIHTAGEKVLKAYSEYSRIIEGKEILLIETGMDTFYGSEEYYTNHPVLDISFCKMLRDNGIKMVGIDAPSPDKEPFMTHKYLLENGILILENLTNLNKIPENTDFEVMALPLKIKADSSPVRAIARVSG
jgi:kynurenine formamidase